jgi:predicted peptidase
MQASSCEPTQIMFDTIREYRTMQPSASPSYPSAPGTYNLTTEVSDPATQERRSVQYTLRIPDAYDGQTALPVILGLHFGGQATDFYGRIFLTLIPEPGLGDLPAFMVAPTTRTRDWTAPDGESAAWAALAAVEGALAVDTTRRVVMGYSLGGIGTWHFAAAFRDHFIAGIPIAGAPRRADLKALRDMPLYVIHSRGDRNVPIDDDEAAVRQLRDMGAPVQFAALPSGGHFDYGPVVAELEHASTWLEQLWRP